VTDIVFILGTRPEAIKVGPVVAECRHLSINVNVLFTGQHTSLLRGTPAESDLADSASLGLVSDGNVDEWIDTAIARLQIAIIERDPQVVVVQGDTMSAYAGAAAASLIDYPVAHIEAGIRSHNDFEPYPEEWIRCAISEFATWHYAPTSTAYANLVSEGIDKNFVYVTGNPIVSALARYAPSARPVGGGNGTIVITLHRRELREGGQLEAVIESIIDTAAEQPKKLFFWSAHPATRSLIGDVPGNITLTEHMDYVSFVGMEARADGILTDSGGIQEEAATLGVPCAVLRNVTDRPESLAANVARLYPPTREGANDGMQALIRGTIPRHPLNIYGSVESAREIALQLQKVVA
jgi:UDP-N-acetylglucosamine 2-epimerase (non-hydrolysing)